MAGGSSRTDGRNIAFLWLLTTILFADVLFFGNNFFQRDLFRYHFPMKKVVHDTILAGHFPYWNRLLSAGQPMAANPAYEVFYPMQWLIFVGPYDFGFALHIVAHVYLAIAGMYLLARALECSATVSIFAAISFALGGFLLGSIMMLPTFFVWAWAPLAGWAVVRVIREPSPRRFAAAALILGMQALIGEPMALLQCWALIALAVIAFRAPIKLFFLFPASLAIAAVQFIPAIDHARDSIRAKGLPFGVVVDFSLHVIRPIEWLVPNFFGVFHWEKIAVWGAMFFPRGTPYLISLSCGLGVSILVLAGIFARVRGWVLLVFVGVVSYILAIGNITPIYRVLYGVGLLRSLRYPEKFIAAFVFAMVIFAAMVAQRFLDGDARVRRCVRVAAFIVVVANAICVIALYLPNSKRRFASLLHLPASLEGMFYAARGALAIGFAIAIAWLLVIEYAEHADKRTWKAAVLILLLADVARLGRQVSGTLPRDFFTPPPWALALRDGPVFNRGEWDSTSPNYRKVRALPAWWGGRNTLQPLTTAAWGIESVLELDYDETALLPTHELLDLLRGNGGQQVVEQVMTLSNVKYALDFRDPDVAVREAASNISAARLVDIKRLENHGRYWGPKLRLLNVSETPNDAVIDVESTGNDALLTATVTRHKYWKATLDGREVPILPADIAYQAIRIPAGRHRVEMRYRNPLIGYSGAISILAIAAALITIVKFRK